MLNKFPFLIAAGLAVSSCKPDELNTDQPIRARILTPTDGSYALQDVTFETLHSLHTVSGSIGKIWGHASASLEADPEEIIATANPDGLYRTRGRSVDLDFIVENDVAVPLNFPSMEILALYYNFERTVLTWQEDLGLPFDEIGLPRVFYNPSLSVSREGVSTELSIVMNAAYLSGIKDLWFFKTSAKEQVPVKMNLGVVAHEFGHFIFDYRFARLDPEAYETEFVTNDYLLSGINEGLADFFSYMVTGNPDEFGKSLPQIADERNLPVSWTLNTLRNADCQGGFYCAGSILASALYEIANSPGQTRMSVGQVVYDALPEFALRWSEEKNNDIVDQSLIIVPIIQQSGQAKATYCAVFKKWFDSPSMQANFPCNT
jgi:hypothetical protein